MLPEKSLTVFVVDDDDSVLKALKRLLKAGGYQVTTFASTEDFLLSGRAGTGGCIVLDIRLPGMSGLDPYDQLAASGANHQSMFSAATSAQLELRGKSLMVGSDPGQKSGCRTHLHTVAPGLGRTHLSRLQIPEFRLLHCNSSDAE